MLVCFCCYCLFVCCCFFFVVVVVVVCCCCFFLFVFCCCFFLLFSNFSIEYVGRFNLEISLKQTIIKLLYELLCLSPRFGMLVQQGLTKSVTKIARNSKYHSRVPKIG